MSVLALPRKTAQVTPAWKVKRGDVVSQQPGSGVSYPGVFAAPCICAQFPSKALNPRGFASAVKSSIVSRRVAVQVKVPSGGCLYYDVGERYENGEFDMATRVEIRKDTETPSERFERVVRKAKKRGQRARARRVEQLSRTEAKSTQRPPEGVS